MALEPGVCAWGAATLFASLSFFSVSYSFRSIEQDGVVLEIVQRRLFRSREQVLEVVGLCVEAPS